MMTKLAPPQIRAMTGLSLPPAILANVRSLAKQLKISLTSGKREPAPTHFASASTAISTAACWRRWKSARAGLTSRTSIRRRWWRWPIAARGITSRRCRCECSAASLHGTASPWWCRRSLGVKSFHDIVRRKIPLHVSTRFSGVNNGDLLYDRDDPVASTDSLSNRSRSGAGECKSAPGRSPGADEGDRQAFDQRRYSTKA